ncbi:MAG TPA: MFS transporter [Chloroflexota bacterium]
MRLPEYIKRQIPNAICIAAITASYGASQTLLSPLLHGRGEDPATIGRLVAAASFVSLLLRIPGGLLYSRQRARVVMVAALLVAGVATVLHPLVINPWLFAGVRLLYGAGYSVATTVNMALFVDTILHEGDRKRSAGMYASAMACGYTLGGLTGGFTGQYLGFTAAYTVLAGLWLVAMMPVLARAPLAGAEPGVRASAELGGTAHAFLGLLAKPGIVSLIMGGFFVNILQSTFSTFVPLLLLALGLGISQVGIMSATFSVTNAITRPIAGFVLDRVDHRSAQNFGILLNGGMLMLFALPLGYVAYLVVAVMAGTGRAVAVVANTVALTHDVPGGMGRGVASGILNAALDLGSIAGPIVGGLFALGVGIHSLWLVGPPIFVASYFVAVLSVSRRKELSPATAAA